MPIEHNLLWLLSHFKVLFCFLNPLFKFSFLNMNIGYEILVIVRHYCKRDDDSLHQKRGQSQNSMILVLIRILYYELIPMGDSNDI